MPCQTLTSKPGIPSATDCVFGSCGMGRVEMPARARILPSLIWLNEVETVIIAVSASLRSRDVSISAPDR